MSISISTSVGQELGRFAAGLSARDVPPEVLEKLRCNVLHNLACAMGAHTAGKELWDGARDRRPEEATLLCDGARVAAEYAAFANAALMHTRAQDDTHFAAKTHVGSAVMPAAYAIAERDGLDGAAFAAAVIAGCEVAAAVGERLAAESTARGFRATPVFGTLGAAAASASLLGLDADATADAIAIASSFSSGLNQMWIDGTSEYRLELGMAARNGIVAAQLAASGFHGAAHWYEGDAGFARAFAGVEDAAGGEWELGERWRLLDVTYKPYPVCAITQSPVQVAIDLATEHDLAPEQISAVRCFLNPADRSYPGTVNDGPFNDVGASLMSAQFCVAMALKHRGATLAGLHEFEDPAILRLVGVTEILADEGLPNLGARVEVTTSAGATHAGELVPDASTYGWDWDGVVANIARMEPEFAVGRPGLDALIADVARLTELDGVGPLLRGTVA
jgi:2-methylcitrate dehydratase PrpD